MIDPPWIKLSPPLRLGAPAPLRIQLTKDETDFLRDLALFRVISAHKPQPIVTLDQIADGSVTRDEPLIIPRLRGRVLP